MGKSQYKNKTRRRHNPIRVPDAPLGTGAAAAAKAAKEQDVLPVIKKLSSADPSERSWALSAISNLTSNDAALRRLFLASGIIQHLIDRLTDSVENVVVEATGTLRNLLVDGGWEVGGEVVNKGGLVALGAMVPKISVTIQKVLSDTKPTSDAEVTTYRLVFPLAENVISIFWSLSETSNRTLQALNAMNLTPFLLAFIQNRDKLPRGVVVAAAQCLYALSSDNPPIQKTLSTSSETAAVLLPVLSATNDNEPTSSRTKGKDKASTGGDASGMEVDSASDEREAKEQLRLEADDERLKLSKVLIAGILRNITTEGHKIVEDLEGKYVVPLLQPVLDVDLREITKEVEANVVEANAPPAAAAQALQTDHRTVNELRLESVERRLSTVMVALEIMTAVCASASAQDEDEQEVASAGPDVEGDDAMDEVDEDEEALIAQGRDPSMMDMVMQENELARLAGGRANAPVDVLSSTARHLRLAALATQTTPLSFPPIPAHDGLVAPSLHPPTTALLSAIHLRALEALNNLLLSFAEAAPALTPPLRQPAQLSPEQAEWNATIQSRLGGLQEIWLSTFSFAKDVVPSKDIVDVKGHEIRLECLEMLCGVWVGLARVGSFGAITVSPDQIQIIMDAFTVVKEDEPKAKLVGALGALAMRPNVTVEENQVIGTFLLSLVQAVGSSTSPSAETVVAALNAIFDVYSDETSFYDRDVFVQSGFLRILVGSVAKVRAMTKSVDRRKEPELRAAAEEAYDNLVAFIKYRRSVQ